MFKIILFQTTNLFYILQKIFYIIDFYINYLYYKIIYIPNYITLK